MATRKYTIPESVQRRREAAYLASQHPPAAQPQPVPEAQPIHAAGGGEIVKIRLGYSYQAERGVRLEFTGRWESIGPSESRPVMREVNNE